MKALFALKGWKQVFDIADVPFNTRVRLASPFNIPSSLQTHPRSTKIVGTVASSLPNELFIQLDKLHPRFNRTNYCVSAYMVTKGIVWIQNVS